MNEDMRLSKRQVQFLSGLFVSRANCLGFDRNIPIGAVANHARIHWDYIERKQSETDNRIKTLEQSNDILRQNVSRLKSKIKEMAERHSRKDNWNKYKRCEAMVERCGIGAQSEHDKVIRFDNPFYIERAKWLEKWRNRWLELADYYKGLLNNYVV